MKTAVEQRVAEIVGELERCWNAADGAGFARAFTADADFVNIRGDHAHGRDVIAHGHHAILHSIYKGSVVRYQLVGARLIAPAVLVAHVRTQLNAPIGPLAGEHRSLYTVVLVQEQDDWRIAAFHNTLIA